MTTCRYLWSAAFAAILVLLTGSSMLVAGGGLRQVSPPPTATVGCGLGADPAVSRPVVDPYRFCPEYLLAEQPRSALAAITSIAFAPPCDEMPAPRDWCGALFLVQPSEGTVVWLGQHDADRGERPLNIFAAGLTTPNGLDWYDGAWYVAGGRHIYRLADEDGDGRADANTVLVDHLPEGSGEWTSSLRIGPDGRIYVSKGASCNACEETDPQRAAIISYALDGTDEQVYATGLHHAFDFTWHPGSGDLWITENGRDFLAPDLPLDELNRASQPGQDFGWPYCYQTAAGLVPDESVAGATAERCADTTPAALIFQAHSSPAGMVFYHGTAFPELEGDLLVVMSGSDNQRIPSGYTLLRICFDADGRLETCRNADGNPLLDSQGNPASQDVLIPVDVNYPDHTLEVLHVQEQSFFPDHPVDITVSPDGFIVISVLEGRLIQLRPSPLQWLLQSEPVHH